MISQTSQNQETAKALWLPGMENRDWSGFDFDSSRSNANPAGVRITADTALYSTVVLSCVRILGESVASLPLNLYKKLPGGGKELQDQNPLFEVLHSTPNSWQTSYEFFEQLMLHVTLHGNAYAYIKSGAKGAVTELIPLHPSRMQVERLENGRLRYRYSEEYGKQKIYSQDRVMHVRWLSDDGVLGMVPVQLSQDAIALSRACEIHGASYFGQGARPGVVLETDQVLEQSSASALRENWERMHRGAANASRTAVLMGGLKAHEIGTSNVDSQFLESRRFQVEEVCRVFRIPPHLVGDLSRSSFSNIEQQSIDFLQHTLQPWLNRLQAVIARDILGDDSLFAEFDPRQMLRGDVAARGSYYTTLWNLGVTSINELRAWESLNPIPEGDQRFVQLNMQTVDEAQSKGQVAVKQAEDELQGEGEEEEVAVEEGTIIDGDTSHPEGSETVGEISMSGSQIGGILQVLEQLSAGLLDKNAAAALIASAFPTIPDKNIQSLVNGTQEKPQQPVPPQLGGPEVPPAEGEQVEVEEEQPQEQLELPLEDDEEPEEDEDEDEDLSGPEERAGPDCGTGGGGFKAGNSCAKGGQAVGGSEKSKKSKGGGSEDGSSGGGGAAVAESGKKKDVHSDWDDGQSAASAGWYHAELDKDGRFEDVKGISSTRGAENVFKVRSDGNAFDVRLVSDKAEYFTQQMDEGRPRSLSFFVNGDIHVTNRGAGMEIIREVSNKTISLYEDKDVPGLSFTADISDGPGRTKLYTSLSKRLTKRHGGDSYASIVPNSGEVSFWVMKKEYKQDFLDYIRVYQKEVTLTPIKDFNPSDIDYSEKNGG